MKDFEDLLLEATDEGLASLGESAKQAIYLHLETNFKINRQDIPLKIEEFTDAIEKIFGTGAKILEIQIMKCLFKKIGHNFKHHWKSKSLTFTEYLAAVRLAKSTYEKHEGTTTELKPQTQLKKDYMYPTILG